MEAKGNSGQDLIVDYIHDEILSTYPFLTSEEKAAYEDKAKEILLTSTASDPGSI